MRAELLLDGSSQGSLADGSVTTAKLADGAVTAEKLAPGVGGSTPIFWSPLRTGSGVYYENGGGAVTIALKLQACKAISVKGIKFSWPSSSNGTITGKVRNSGGTVLATKALSSSASGEKTITFDSPVSIAQGAVFSIGIFDGAGYPVMPTYPSVAMPTIMGDVLLLQHCYASGDANPTSDDGGRWALEPVL